MVELSSVGMVPALWAAAVTTIEAIFGVLLGLVLPGYALTASWPAGALGTWERAVLSLALSIAVDVAGGLVLNATPFGLQPASWATFLAGTTVVAAAVAFLIRRGGWTSRPVWRQLRTGALRMLPFGLAALVATGAVAFAYVGAVEERTPGFTELWILPAATTADGSVQLGIKNLEGATTRYRLVLATGDVVVREWPAIQLGPNEQWQVVVEVPARQATAETVSAALYRLDSPGAVYRSVRLSLLPGGEPSP